MNGTANSRQARSCSKFAVTNDMCVVCRGLNYLNKLSEPKMKMQKGLIIN